jgi:lysophospholipase L1-like esterase
VFVAAICALAMLAMLAAPAPPLVVALGDSITYGYGLPSPSTQNYAALFARRIHARLVNLAVPGYQCEDVADNEIPRMPRGASIVILNCGTNDIGGFGFSGDGKPDGSKRTSAVNAIELAGAGKAFAHALALIHVRAPRAKIYLVSLRHWQRMTGAEAARFANDVNAWNAMLTATGLQIVDAGNDPRMYRSTYIQADFLHPNVAGNAAIASDFR